MPYTDTVEALSVSGAGKSANLRENPVGFLAGAVMAGVYVGFGIVLIFALGAAVPAGAQKVVMASAFGIALTLVVFAGAELYTGHTMYMAFGALTKRCSLGEVVAVWSASWLGNLVGSVGLAALIAAGVGWDGGNLGGELLEKVAQHKSQSAALHLFARGVACNWLICLALWMSARTTSDSTKCILIFWCLLGFIGLGLEHCVANMTLLSANLFLNGMSASGWLGMAHNLLWVTLGNTFAGAVCMGVGYWVAAGLHRRGGAGEAGHGGGVDAES